MSADARLVFSSAHGRVCPDCNRPVAQCACSAPQAPRRSGPVRVRLDTNRRRGKAVTVITGVPLAAEALCDLAKRLKRECGAGGTVKDGDVEIQGDHRRAVVAALEGMGWKVKKD